MELTVAVLTVTVFDSYIFCRLHLRSLTAILFTGYTAGRYSLDVCAFSDYTFDRYSFDGYTFDAYDFDGYIFSAGILSTGTILTVTLLAVTVVMTVVHS